MKFCTNLISFWFIFFLFGSISVCFSQYVVSYEKNFKPVLVNDIWNFEIISLYHSEKPFNIIIEVFSDNNSLLLSSSINNILPEKSPLSFTEYIQYNTPVFIFNDSKSSKILETSGSFECQQIFLNIDIIDSFDNIIIYNVKKKFFLLETPTAINKISNPDFSGSMSLSYDYYLNHENTGGIIAIAETNMSLWSLPFKAGLLYSENANPQIQNLYFNFDSKKFQNIILNENRNHVLDSLRKGHNSSFDFAKMISDISPFQNSVDSLSLLRENYVDSMYLLKEVYGDSVFSHGNNEIASAYANLEDKLQSVDNEIQGIISGISSDNSLLKGDSLLKTTTNVSKYSKSFSNKIKVINDFNVGRFYLNVHELAVFGQNLTGLHVSLVHRKNYFETFAGKNIKFHSENPQYLNCGLVIGHVSTSSHYKLYLIRMNSVNNNNFDFNHRYGYNYLIGGSNFLRIGKRIEISNDLFGSSFSIIDQGLQNFENIIMQNDINGNTGFAFRSIAKVNISRQTDCEFEVRKTSADYKTFGNDFIFPSSVDYIFKLNQGFLERRIKLSVMTASKQQEFVFKTATFRLKNDVAFSFLKFPRILVSYMWVSQNNNLSAFNNNMFSVNINKHIKKRKAQHLLNGLFVFQKNKFFNNLVSFENQSSNCMFSYSVVPKPKVSYSFMLRNLQFKSSGEAINIYSAVLGYSFPVLKNISCSGNINYSLSNQSNLFVFSLGTQYNTKHGISFGLIVNSKIYNYGNDFFIEDLFNRISVSYRF